MHLTIQIGYNIYEGTTFEGKTLIPILQSIEAKYQLSKPVVIADSRLLSKENLDLLKKINSSLQSELD